MGIIAFERKQESYKYDLSELLGVVSNRPVKKEKAYFCSQFVYAVLVQTGIELFDKPA